jgi:peptidoglycan/LPS O-acetylase OafA/YrhL
MQNAKIDHFESVHLLRGIAAMLVLIDHSFRSIYFWDVPWFDKAILNLGQIGVSVFFVISGFVLPLSLQKSYRFQDFPRFLARRFVRIEPTYLASMVVAIAWVWTATRMAPNATPWQFDLGQIGAHLLYLVPFTNYEWVNGVYWTLAIEFQFYLFIGALFPIFRVIANSNVYGAGMLIVIFSAAAFFYLGMHLTQPTTTCR